MTLNPATTALLAMDFQNGIVPLIPGDSSAMLAREAELITRVRAAGGQIAYVRVAFTPQDVEAMPASAGMRAAVERRGADAMGADADATQVTDALAPRDGDIIVRKTRVGPFLTTDLDAQLRARGVDTVVLTGVSTSGVVFSAVPDAYDRDYTVIVLSDLVADPDHELHELLLQRVFPKRARVITSAELEAELTS